MSKILKTLFQGHNFRGIENAAKTDRREWTEKNSNGWVGCKIDDL